MTCLPSISLYKIPASNSKKWGPCRLVPPQAILSVSTQATHLCIHDLTLIARHGAIMKECARVEIRATCTAAAVVAKVGK